MILKSQLVGPGQRLNWHSFQAYEMNAQPQSQFFEITILWRNDMVLIWNAPRPEFFVACHFSPGTWDFRTWATSRRALPWQCLTMRTRHTRLCVCRCPPTLHDLQIYTCWWRPGWSGCCHNFDLERRIMQTSSSLADGRATPQKEIHAMNFRFVYIFYFCSAILHLIQGFALLNTPASLQPQAMTVQGQHFADVAPQVVYLFLESMNRAALLWSKTHGMLALAKTTAGARRRLARSPRLLGGLFSKPIFEYR